MNETNAVVKVDDTTPQALMRRATDVAGVCKEIVSRTAQNIQGKRYVRVEGWEAIATAHGCVAGARNVEKVEGGFRAMGEIRRADTGVVIATAEGFVGDDEKMWSGRPEYARRAMCQTRAISRACRSCFAHVVVLIDSDLSTTPAEEVPQEGFQDSPKRQAAVVNVESEPVNPVAGGQSNGMATLIEFKEVSGTSARGPWTAWFCTFEDAGGVKLEAGTFDKKIAESLPTLKGKEVNFSIKPGKKPGKFEITSLEAADGVNF